MPIHDWSRVDPNVYHHFHQFWTVEICRSLNAGLLPSGYSALVEQHAGKPVPDVLAVERRPKRKPTSAGGALMTTQPKTRHTVKSEKEILAARGNRIVIKHRLGELVCVIEVMSPGNKHSKLAIRQFVEKAIDFLQSGVHLLVIDLFPPSPRDPQGIHKAIWDEVEESPFELPADKPLTLAAYAAGNLIAGLPTTANVEPVGVGDMLLDMPAYLVWGEYVPVPLEPTYQAAWESCPADMRELVETGRLAGEEE
jgi:Protein of unknown function (DUF4058)